MDIDGEYDRRDFAKIAGLSAIAAATGTTSTAVSVADLLSDDSSEESTGETTTDSPTPGTSDSGGGADNRTTTPTLDETETPYGTPYDPETSTPFDECNIFTTQGYAEVNEILGDARGYFEGANIDREVNAEAVGWSYDEGSGTIMGKVEGYSDGSSSNTIVLDRGDYDAEMLRKSGFKDMNSSEREEFLDSLLVESQC